jgi:signal peptidase II
VRSMTRPLAFWILIFCFVSDQLLKVACRQFLTPHEPLSIWGEQLQLTLLENRAGVMGIDLLPMWVLSLLSLLAIFFIAYWLYRILPSREPLARILPWILGGALGNFYDRLFRGSVTDFFDVNIPDLHINPFDLLGLHFAGFHLERWWVFNLADSFIFVGMLVIVFLSLSGQLEDTPTS